MNNPNQDQDRIDAYLRHEMSDSERQVFEKQLQQDKTLREAFEFTKELIMALKDREAKRKKVSAWEVELQQEADLKRRKIRFVRYSAIGFGIAACLAVGVFLQPLLMFNSSPSVSDVSSTQSLYRGTSETDTQIQSALQKQDYTQALSLVETKEQEYAQRLVALLASDTISEEQAYEVSLIETQMYDLMWYKILATQGTGDIQGTRELLQYYLSQDGNHRREAISLWERLSKK